MEQTDAAARIAPSSSATDALLEVAPQPDRVLLHPRDARASVALLLGAILAGGSAVLVEQTDAAALALTATAERARLLA